MKKLITAILIVAIVLTISLPALAADTEHQENENALASLWSFLADIGKSIAGMWVSITILAISGAGFLIVYLRRATPSHLTMTAISRRLTFVAYYTA